MKRIHGGDWAAYRARYGRDPLDFSQNISPLGLPAGVAAAIRAAVEDGAAARYPDPGCTALRRALAERWDRAEDQILCGNGACELIFRFALAVRPARALVAAPTFGEYERALALAGAAVTRVPLSPADGWAAAPALRRAVERMGRVEAVILCQPNNPTGRCEEKGEVLALAAACARAGARLLVDECFLPFAEEEGALTLLPHLAALPQVAVLRAATKLYALAGVRLGACVSADAALLRRMGECGQPWPVSALAQRAGLAALADETYPSRVRALLRQERPRLRNGLLNLGFSVPEGRANFLLLRTGRPELGEQLAARGMLIRDCREMPGLCPGDYRAAVRRGEDNRALLRAMEEVLKWDESC